MQSTIDSRHQKVCKAVSSSCGLVLIYIVGQDCGSYMSDFFSNGAPGYLLNNATNMCEYCAYKVGDEFFKPLGYEFSNRWRDLGIFAAFIGSNLIILFVAVCQLAIYIVNIKLTIIARLVISISTVAEQQCLSWYNATIQMRNTSQTDLGPHEHRVCTVIFSRFPILHQRRGSHNSFTRWSSNCTASTSCYVRFVFHSHAFDVLRD